MFMREVAIGGVYYAKVSGSIVRVRLDAHSPRGGWTATNLKTGRALHIKSARRLRRAVEDAAPAVAERTIDPERCATPGCAGTPALTYLGRPLCAGCWAEHCPEEAKQTPAASVGATDHHAADEAANDEEHDMATKTTKKSGAKKAKGSRTKAAKKRAPEADSGTKPVAKPKKQATKTAGEPKRLSALDAAATVLKKAGKPMVAQELITAMADQGLWTSPGGKTPHATLYAAMIREIGTKGAESRFTKVDRGQFSAAR